MKFLRSYPLRLIGAAGVPLALLAFVLAAPDARGGERSARGRGDVEAKLAYCEDCHGPSGQGFHGYFPIPRLAGQQTDFTDPALLNGVIQPLSGPEPRP